jgi:hypothetical protein
MCAICLEEQFNEEDCCMITGCEHKFHKECITKLILHVNSSNGKWNCPLCRRNFINVIDLANKDEIKKYEEDKLNKVYDKIDETYYQREELYDETYYQHEELYDETYYQREELYYQNEEFYESSHYQYGEHFDNLDDLYESSYYQNEQHFDNLDNIHQDESRDNAYIDDLSNELFHYVLDKEKEDEELEISMLEN